MATDNNGIPLWTTSPPLLTPAETMDTTLPDDLERSAPEKRRETSGRVYSACQRCRTRKVKCSGAQPCILCARSGWDCFFAPLNKRGRKKRRFVSQQKGGSEGGVTHQPNPTDHKCHGAPGVGQLTPPPPSTTTTDILAETTTTEADISPRHPRSERKIVNTLDPLAAKRQRATRAGVGVYQARTGACQFYGASSNLSMFQRIYERVHQSKVSDDKSGNAIRLWGLDKFAFPPDTPDYAHHNQEGRCLPVFLADELGCRFISNYFEVAHPQFPFLDRAEILESWQSFWTPPDPQIDTHYSNKLTRKNICLMVLAIGAVMSAPAVASAESRDDLDAITLGRWASYLSSRAQLSVYSFEDASLKGVHLFLLKAIYALALMRSNDAYMYTGHAALNALALGMNRAQVADGNSPSLYRLRVTFWSLYATEKLISLLHGRASCLRDDFIDTALPEHLASLAKGGDGAEHLTDMSYLHGMVDLSAVADRINSAIYFPKTTSSAPLTVYESICFDCETALNKAISNLPPFLHFFDSSIPTSPHTWQEVQRTHLGLTYYHCLFLIYRPTLLLVSNFDSKKEALEELRSQGLQDPQGSIDKALSASKKLITLALEAYTNRAPQMRQDANVAYNVTAACLTLLFDLVGGPGKTAAGDVAATFDSVQEGIKCLDFMEHHGPRFGRLTLSSYIIRVAKDAFRSTMGSNVTTTNEAFARHDYGSHKNDAVSTDGNVAVTSHDRMYDEHIASQYVPGLGSSAAEVAPGPEQHVTTELDSLLDQFPWLGASSAYVPSAQEESRSLADNVFNSTAMDHLSAFASTIYTGEEPHSSEGYNSNSFGITLANDGKVNTAPTWAQSGYGNIDARYCRKA